MRSVALAAVILGVLVQVPLLVAQTGEESQPLVPVTDLAPQDGAVSAPAPAAPPAPAPAPSEPASPEPPAPVPGDQVAAGTAPALQPAENLEPAPAVEPLGEPAQAGPEEPAPEDPDDDEPPPEEDDTDPEEFEREFEDVPEEEMPPLTHRPGPTATATPAGGLPQTGSDVVILELMGGLLMGVGLALRLALSTD